MDELNSYADHKISIVVVNRKGTDESLAKADLDQEKYVKDKLT